MSPAEQPLPPQFVRAPVPLPQPPVGDVIECPGTLEVFESVPTVLEVQVMGRPEPLIEWFVNDRPVRPDYKHKVITLPEGTHCMTLESPSPINDTGRYRCVASNPYGTSQLVLTVKVEPKQQPKVQPPKFLTKPQPTITKKPQEPVMLEATFEGSPPPIISWHKDGKPGLTPYPEIRQPPMPVCLKEGEKAHFSTMITSNPPPVVEWYVNGQLVVPGQKLDTDGNPKESTSFDGLLHHLCIQNCHPDDAGQVTVEARRSDVPIEVSRNEPNALVTATTSLEVIPAPSKVPQLRSVPRPVEAAPVPIIERPAEQFPPMKPPQFATILHTVNTPCGQPTTFEVDFLGEPLPDVVWYKDGVEVHNVVPCEVTSSPNRSILRIPNTQPQAAGVYSAVATNPAGQATTTSRLNVTQPIHEAPPGSAPSFLQPLPLQSAHLQPGQAVTFECKVVGEPSPRVFWEHDGKPVEQTESVRCFDQPPFHKLVLCQATLETAGTYTCIAINPHGQDSFTTNVSVEKPEQAPQQPPMILEGPKNLNVQEASPATFVAQVAGAPGNLS
ncbi:unnamed protein product [Schistocephalus solidus]|uniref:Titin n=1 Tax=Schistocephalus solidus TaxID=70667 RepID=A0A183SUJ9_SCHSO|nr:unnamed protein product [Schistocephalus solidus]